MKHEEIPHQDITDRIIGAAMRVHNRLGPGLKERLYQTALTVEMAKDGLAVAEEYYLEVYDGETWLGRLYLDHWVNECVVVEDKATAHPTGDTELAQVITYLAATGAQVGLLLNFGPERLEYRRILPPKAMQDWRQRITPYLWRPAAPAFPPPGSHSSPGSTASLPSSAPSSAADIRDPLSRSAPSSAADIRDPLPRSAPSSAADIRDPLPKSLAQLTEEMHRFVTAKGWYDAGSPRPQTPRNLAASLAIEAAEVLELYQWGEAAEPSELAGELADVTLYLLQLASLAGVDLERAVLDKLQVNYQREWKGRERSTVNNEP
jgi:GxxExxY protein